MTLIRKDGLIGLPDERFQRLIILTSGIHFPSSVLFLAVDFSACTSGSVLIHFPRFRSGIS
jgi:hypothetical protein